MKKLFTRKLGVMKYNLGILENILKVKYKWESHVLEK
jgi:hypothetical protein